jgi:hypothetical protein
LGKCADVLGLVLSPHTREAPQVQLGVIGRHGQRLVEILRLPQLRAMRVKGASGAVGGQIHKSGPQQFPERLREGESNSRKLTACTRFVKA